MPSFKDHFSAAAAGYALHRPQYPPALVRALAAHCPQRQLAWDAGCGNGQLSVQLADAFERVCATDASPEQIAQARPHPRVEYRVARAEDGAVQTGIADASADLCVAAQAAHWFDMEGFNAQLRRVSKPGGVAALICYGLMTVANASVDAQIRNFYFGELAAFWPQERRHVQDGYARLNFPFAPLPIPPLAMTCRWNLAALRGYIDTWSAVTAMKKSGNEKAISAFLHALENAWGLPQTEIDVAFPLVVRAGRL
jgi:SAM-dependent methyltransferase